MSKGLLKTLSLLIVVVMISALFAACGVKSNEATGAANTESTAVSKAEATAKEAPAASDLTKEFLTLKVHYPGDQSKRMGEFLDNEFKQKLKDELNTAVEVSWSPWDQYWNKKDMMIAAGEQIDWFWDGAPDLSKVVGAKSCQPIDELLEKYGQDIKKAIPEENFKSFVIDGKLMGIPSQYAPTSEKFRSILVRQDILDGVGMKEIKTIADMNQLGELVQTKFPGMKYIAYDPYMPLTRETDTRNISYDANNFIIVDEDTGKAEFAALTEGWKKASMQAYEWNKKGWIPEEVTVKQKEQVNRMKSGKYVESEGAISRPLEDIADLRKNVPDATLVEFVIAPEKPRYKTMASSEGIFIGSTAKYPERAMMMLNWMLQSKENYLFCIYGVDGKDYTMENGRIKLINQDSLWYEWMFRNLNYMEFPDNVSDEFIESFKNWDNDAKLSCHFGFAFDPTAVRSEEAKINQISTEKLLPISTGFVDYETAFPEAEKALKAAGVDKYVAEYQKQLDAFIAANKH